MRSTQRYKSFIRSVIRGELNSLPYFSETFRCNLMFYESENFPDSSLHDILGPKMLGFLFLRK